MTSIDHAIRLIRSCPRVALFNVADLPRSTPPRYHGLKRKKRGLSHRGQSQFQAWKPLGQLEHKMPFYLSVPREPYNVQSMELARISLLELQRMIDLDRIDAGEPIDISTLCNSGLHKLDAEHKRQYGFQLTDEGADLFVTPINIEVQFASELVIAAVERVGGIIATRFYDLFSVWAKSDPLTFFKRGIPIPKAKLPPPDLLPYYANAENRGYLAKQEDVDAARLWLAQKFGYSVTNPAEQSERRRQLMLLRKDPRQIFFGLAPGSLVSLMDQTVYKPRCEELERYYNS